MLKPSEYGVLLIRNDTDKPRLLSSDRLTDKLIMDEVKDMIDCGASEVLVFKLDASTCRHFRMRPAEFEELPQYAPPQAATS
jgi:hypothetical protein